MELKLFLLVLVSLFCVGQNWTAPDFCRGRTCPVFRLIQQHQEYEERLYDPTEWITTEIKPRDDGNDVASVLAAHEVLKKFVKERSLEDATNTWPVLINITNDNDHWLSWFVTPTTLNTTMPELTAGAEVTLLRRPEATVYVRVFGGSPSLDNGKKNAHKLCEVVPTSCSNGYTGAGYDTYFDLFHHNEAWIDKP